MLPARSNPFATDRITRLLPFDPGWCGRDWDELMHQLASQQWQGQVTGPHGSGKTAFLDALAPRLNQLGFSVIPLFLNRESRRVPGEFWDSVTRAGSGGENSPAICLMDGAEQLGPLAWRQFLRKSAKTFEGLVVTTHQMLPGPLPRFLHTRSSPEMLEAFIDQLAPGFGLTFPEIRAIHQECEGNLREALWVCYDRASRMPLAPAPGVSSSISQAGSLRA